MRSNNTSILLLFILFFTLIGCRSSKENQAEKPKFSAALIILKNGILELTDEGGNILRTIKSVEPIHDFLWTDSSTIFFTAKKGGNLLLSKYEVQADSVVRIAEINIKSENTEFWNGGKHAQMFIKDGKLYIECDFYQEMPLFFIAKQVTEVDLKSGNYTVLDRNNVQTDALPTTASVEMLSGERKPKGKFEVTKKIELAYTDESGQKKVITKTPFSKESKQNGGGLFYQCLPSGKNLIFYVITAVGDYIHGPVYVVNIDGSAQNKLAEDIFGFDAFVTQPAGLVYYTNGDGLYRLKDDNTSQLIRQEVTKVRSFGTHLFLRFNN